MNPIQYCLANSTTLTFISQVTSTSSVTSLSWSQGSEYVYGISGSNVSIYTRIMSNIRGFTPYHTWMYM